MSKRQYMIVFPFGWALLHPLIWLVGFAAPPPPRALLWLASSNISRNLIGWRLCNRAVSAILYSLIFVF